MIIHFIHSGEQPLQSRLEIQPQDPDDLLRVKLLPGRWYDSEREVWIVPMTIGLALTLERMGILPELLALIQTQEATLLASMTSPAEILTPKALDKISTDQAIREAFANHYLTTHRGNDEDYLRVHHEVMSAPEVKPNKRRRKTEREVKTRQIKEGRID